MPGWKNDHATFLVGCGVLGVGVFVGQLHVHVLNLLGDPSPSCKFFACTYLGSLVGFVALCRKECRAAMSNPAWNSGIPLQQALVALVPCVEQ